MKRNVFIIIIFVVSCCLLTNCKKDNTIYNVYFYTNKDTSVVHLSLYINDNKKGEIPYLNPKPTCENDSLKQLSFLQVLSSDKYVMTAKDEQGNIKSEHVIKISDSSTSVKSKTGQQETTITDNCVIIGLFY
jgi:hypothetical protein